MRGTRGTERLWHRWQCIDSDLQDILDPEEGSGCEERWKNLSDELTSKMWGIFDETGIFIALCRHSFVLLVADMVRSGEL